eukprot:TRINITY_DN6416_c0_g1_i1.p1 TRINITY_DN6416_c0_g1~~TRINITY_DN6416_c0_g1_i1.p1  ORF type:complete len:246 (+),score=54.47 TRINITY_DN6416_c0_g1_i1:147-884(+)
METDPTLIQLHDETIPNAIKALKESNTTLDQIATYCRDLKKSTDYDAIFTQTQEYTKDALMNVAYHVHTVGTYLTTFLQFQMTELDKLDTVMGNITQRLKYFHDSVGNQSYTARENERQYHRTHRLQKIDESAIPESSNALPQFSRQKISIDSLDQMNLMVAYSPDVVVPAPPPSQTPLVMKTKKVNRKIATSGKNSTPRRKGEEIPSSDIDLPPPPPPPDMELPPPPPPPDMELPPPPPPEDEY